MPVDIRGTLDSRLDTDARIGVGHKKTCIQITLQDRCLQARPEATIYPNEWTNFDQGAIRPNKEGKFCHYERGQKCYKIKDGGINIIKGWTSIKQEKL